MHINERLKHAAAEWKKDVQSTGNYHDYCTRALDLARERQALNAARQQHAVSLHRLRRVQLGIFASGVIVFGAAVISVVF